LQVIWQIFGKKMAKIWQRTITNVSIFLSIPAPAKVSRLLDALPFSTFEEQSKWQQHFPTQQKHRLTAKSAS
jgi:hypothetical protein